MPLFPYSYKKVSDKTRVRVSNHFYYSDFGVLEGRDTRQYGRRYICTGTPGTGFIERDSESHSYHEFVRDYLTLQRPSYFRLLTGREPNYDRELKCANANPRMLCQRSHSGTARGDDATLYPRH